MFLLGHKMAASKIITLNMLMLTYCSYYKLHKCELQCKVLVSKRALQILTTRLYRIDGNKNRTHNLIVSYSDRNLYLEYPPSPGCDICCDYPKGVIPSGP